MKSLVVLLKGWTPGEGGHRHREPREEGCVLQLEVPWTANGLTRLAAWPHAAYLELQQELERDFEARLRSTTLVAAAMKERGDV